MAVLWRLMLVPLALASGANPIRKAGNLDRTRSVPSQRSLCEVVNLLQKMKMKVEKEGVAQRVK